jgi:hypothetical protein
VRSPIQVRDVDAGFVAVDVQSDGLADAIFFYDLGVLADERSRRRILPGAFCERDGRAVHEAFRFAGPSGVSFSLQSRPEELVLLAADHGELMQGLDGKVRVTRCIGVTDVDRSDEFLGQIRNIRIVEAMRIRRLLAIALGDSERDRVAEATVELQAREQVRTPAVALVECFRYEFVHNVSDSSGSKEHEGNDEQGPDRHQDVTELRYLFGIGTEVKQNSLAFRRARRYAPERMFTFGYGRSETGEEVVLVREAGPGDQITFETAEEAAAAAMYALDIERAIAKGPLAYLN